MAIKKSDLYSSLWASCDALRGGMDASQYKDYVLFMLFIKYVSDKYADSQDLRPAIVIPQGASFKDMVALKGKSDIGDRINTDIIQPLVDANTRLARTVLKQWQRLADTVAALKKQLREAEAALDTLAFQKVPKLKEGEVKALVIDDKWLARLHTDVQGELDRISQTLTGRIRELAERYATPLPQLADEVEALARRVDEHLKKMGFAWT